MKDFSDTTERKDFSKLPEEFSYLDEIIASDPPKGELKEALDLYVMTLKCFGRGAWTDDKLAKVLAWSWMSSFCEACVFSGIRIPLQIATYRYGIRGCCIPKIELMREHVAPKIKEICEFQEKTPWLESLMDEYKIKDWKKINLKDNMEVLKAPWMA